MALSSRGSKGASFIEACEARPRFGGGAGARAARLRGGWGALTLPLALAAACGGSSAPAAESREPGASSQQKERSGLRQSAVPDTGEDEGGGMEVEGLRGHLTPYQIQMGIRPHQRELSRCYAEHAEFEYIGGHIVFGFDVTREGHVKAPRIDESDLGAWEVEACLLEVVERMTFEPPDGGAARVTLPLDFEARVASAFWHEERAGPELEAPPSVPASERDEGSEGREQKGRRADAGNEEEEPATKSLDLEACAEEAEAGPPAGLTITLYVEKDGRVRSAGFSADAPIDSSWADCATDRITSWRMSAPEAPGVSVAKLAFPFPPAP